MDMNISKLIEKTELELERLRAKDKLDKERKRKAEDEREGYSFKRRKPEVLMYILRYLY